MTVASLPAPAIRATARPMDLARARSLLGLVLMPWLWVSDKMHSSPLFRRIVAIEPAAVGLWIAAASWSSDHLTDGVIPDDDLPWLFPGALQLAPALVTAAAWKRGRRAHQFVRDDELFRIPSREKVEAERNGAAERQRRSRERRSPSHRDIGVTHTGSHGVSHSAQSRSNPDLTNLINQASGNWALVPDDDPILRSVIDSIYRRTSRVLAAAEARVVATGILAGRSASDPAAYAAKAIAAEPDPQRRWLDGLSDVPALSAPWCGNCDEATRLIDPDSPRRCPKCHPLRDES